MAFRLVSDTLSPTTGSHAEHNILDDRIDVARAGVPPTSAFAPSHWRSEREMTPAWREWRNSMRGISGSG